MWDPPLQLSKPGLFITGTDTGVGKTVVTCAIAAALRGRGLRVGVSKPFASGCRREAGELVSDDARALAHFAGSHEPLSLISPLRFEPPLAPAAAAQQTGAAMDWPVLGESLRQLNARHDCLLIEGVGGLLVPLDPDDPQRTVLELIRAVGYPVVIVVRATLGTLNHTAMTVRLLRHAGCRIAGLVVNHASATDGDASIQSNDHWLRRMNAAPILASIGRCDPTHIQPHHGRMPSPILESVTRCHWPSLLAPASPV